jgi:polar amino acid transport system substrate-binding protein
MIVRITCLMLVCLFVLPFDHAQAQRASVLPKRELIVGVKDAPPFALKASDGAWSGLSIELWRQVAKAQNLKYRFVEARDMPELIQETEAGRFDVAVGAITVTVDREKVLDFTQSYYSTGTGIAVPIVSVMNWGTLQRALTSFNFLQAILALIGLTLSAGILVWLLERRQNEYFGGSITKGISSSVWWSTLAMTQRSSAEKGPQTILGRGLAVVWLIVSVITIAVFTAGVTSVLTTSQIQGTIYGVADLASVRVGTVSGTSSEGDLIRRKLKFQPYDTPIDGLRALRAGRLDAFVYDKPLLAWAIRQGYASRLKLLDISIETQNYAFALPPDSPLRKPLSIAILDALQREAWSEARIRYLGEDSLSSP